MINVWYEIPQLLYQNFFTKLNKSEFDAENEKQHINVNDNQVTFDRIQL